MVILTFAFLHSTHYSYIKLWLRVRDLEPLLRYITGIYRAKILQPATSTMAHETTHVSAVTLLLGDEAREIMMCSGLPLQELLQCVAAGFPGANKVPVAVRHATNHICYPLSLLCRSPELFENAAFHLVLEKESIATQEFVRRGSKHRHRAHHSRKRGARTRNTPDRRENQILTTSDVQDEDADSLQHFEAASTEDELDLDLSDFELPQLVNVFTQACPTGALDRITFNRCLEKILSQSGRYDPQARKMFTKLFHIFEEQSECPDTVDVADFLGGVSVFACGERQEKISSTFELYDVDGDGFITKEEMTKYLTAVFLVIKGTSPRHFQDNRCVAVLSVLRLLLLLTSCCISFLFAFLVFSINPAELGVATASQCFDDSTLNEEGKLSYDAFRKWYMKPGPTQLITAERGRGSEETKRDNDVQPEVLDVGTLREVTGLATLSMSDLYAFLNGASKEALTRAEFKSSFSALLKTLNRKATYEIVTFLDRLFDAFDENKSDSVDFVELCTGLSILCGSLDEDKVVAAFSLIDSDGDGYITQQELETYLKAVFKIIYETTPAARQLIGIDAKRLAYYTALQAFDDWDKNRDGKLTLKEFHSWYWVYGDYQQSMMNSRSVIQNQPESNSSHFFGTSDFVASLTGLRDRAASDVFEIIAAKVNEDGVLSREAFFSIVDELVEENVANTNRSLSTEEKDQLQKILEAVFDGFDTDHDGFVDFCELSSGISILCSGSQQEKVKSTFDLFDINQDGFISRDEMETYLASVYRIIFMTSPELTQHLCGISPEELAHITAAEAFILADANEDGRLSFDEFTKWYSTQGTAQRSSVKSPVPNTEGDLSTSNGATTSAKISLITSKDALNEMKELTNLDAYDVTEIFDFFQAAADQNGNVSQPLFMRCFNKLQAKDRQLSLEKQLKTQSLLKEIFELFDPNQNGTVNVQELCAGLSILCGGSRADRAKSMFTLYDVDHDGFVSPEEMALYLTSVFKVLFKAHPELPAKTEMMPEQLAKSTTRECFLAFDQNQDGLLSFDEFRVWFEHQNSHTRQKEKLSGATNGYDLSIPVEIAKKLSGLERISLEEMSNIFGAAVGGGERISRRIFDECFYTQICGKIIPSFSKDYSTRMQVIDRLFTAFDTEHKGIANMKELLSGLSILCRTSTQDEKVLAAFKIYDANKDGAISKNEMTHYLESVFKLLFALDPTREQQLGTSANTLAVATTSEIFEVADVNQDGELNFKEFQRWYTRPEHVSFNDIAAPLDLDEVRQLTNLGNVDVVEVFKRFADHADARGMLNRSSFTRCLFEIVESASPRTQIEKMRAKLVAGRLYAAFDPDGNGSVDFRELASGLTVLCNGARDVKVKDALRLCDLNVDGFISLDEMKRYLTSIFRVLYEVQPKMKRETGVSPDELGVVTAEQAFFEADLNRDGQLSYDEFLRWYNSPTQGGISSVVTKNAIVDSPLQWMPLSDLKQLTNLAQYEPEEVFEIFAGEADEDGYLSRGAFDESFRKVINGQTINTRASDPDTQNKMQTVVGCLFDLFDKDKKGMVDFGEIASGLSILCGGTEIQKVEAAFSLVDFNGDGFISLDEMTRYLTSVFRVLFQVSPDTQSLGITPEELGEVTAQQAFAEADQNHDGQLTLKEFQLWYQRSGSIGEVAKNVKQLVNLAEARHVPNLQARVPMEALNALAECVDEQGYVSRKAFDHFCQHIISSIQDTKLDGYERIDIFFNSIFNLLDVDKNGVVDLSEIVNSLSVFFGCLSEELTRSAFSLYDYNGDGYISIDEMTRHLTSVFRLLVEASPSRLQHIIGDSPEHLAARTAKQAFDEADLVQENRLSYLEFCKWFTRANVAYMYRLFQNNIPEWFSLREVRRLTNLKSFSTQQALNTFSKLTAADNTMDRGTFRQAFGLFEVESGHKHTKDRLRTLVDRIFDLFDADKNGLVDFQELVRGLSMLCRTPHTDEVRTAFNLYDLNHDGYIALGEMRLYLTVVFKVLFEMKSDSEASMGVTPEELGVITAEQAFAEADQDRDGKLSFAEFRQWFMQSKAVENVGQVDQQHQQARTVEGNVPEWVSLDVVKHMTNLEKYTANEVFEIFANRCSEDGTLGREAFEECFEQLVDEQYKIDEVSLARLRLILNRLFVIFDEDNSGTVDFCELSSGLSVLCAGSREEKVRAAFSLYDLNQDGFIALDEMVRYLASVFKVLYEASPGTDVKLGVQPKELAKITAEQCFLEADLNKDGKLSFDEFVAWYSKSAEFIKPAAAATSIFGQQLIEDIATEDLTCARPRDDSPSRELIRATMTPESPRRTVRNIDKDPQLVTMDSPSVTSLLDQFQDLKRINDDTPLSPHTASALTMNSSNLEHFRQLLKLDTYEVNDLLEIFAEAAPSGVLSFAAFKKCFDQIVRLAGGHESHGERQEADALIRRLFQVFDTDNSNTVDFGELASGLSILSGSSVDDKVRAAFQLYDIDGDGCITKEEMINYMTSIFKVMNETTGSSDFRMGVSPEELARITANRCFDEADLNGDDQLSFEEFKKWCTPNTSEPLKRS
ncbi:putative calcium binding protein [Plasmopara halstedii]